MVNMTLALPTDLKAQMEKYPEVNWSEVARQAFGKKLGDLLVLEKIATHGQLSEEEAIELGRKVNQALYSQGYTGG